MWSVKGVRQVPFRLPELIEALALEHRLFVVEGEKDVLTLARHGIPATCNAGGAHKWDPAFAEHLAGADVIVIPDNDKDGHEHAQEVARSLAGKAARIRLLALPGLADKGDASDWFVAGGTAEAFNALVDQAPDWTDNGTQASDETPQHNGRILRGTEFADLSTSSRKVWLVHHLLAIGEISVWYGEPGSGKSVGIEDLGLHVAVGRVWHGRQVKQCAVLYVALERANVVQRRAIAWGLEHGLSREQLPFKVIRGPLDFRDPQVAADIVATLEDLARRHGCEAGLIIVDTVSRALCGGDENCPKDMGALIANIGRIQSAIGVHIALTHHQPVDGKERMRGHGALLGAVDTTIHVVNKDGTRLAEVVKLERPRGRPAHRLHPEVRHHRPGRRLRRSGHRAGGGRGPGADDRQGGKASGEDSKERHARPECAARCRRRLRTARGQCARSGRHAGRHPRSMAHLRIPPRPWR